MLTFIHHSECKSFAKSLCIGLKNVTSVFIELGKAIIICHLQCHGSGFKKYVYCTHVLFAATFFSQRQSDDIIVMMREEYVFKKDNLIHIFRHKNPSEFYSSAVSLDFFVGELWTKSTTGSKDVVKAVQFIIYFWVLLSFSLGQRSELLF